LTGSLDSTKWLRQYSPREIEEKSSL